MHSRGARGVSSRGGRGTLPQRGRKVYGIGVDRFIEPVDDPIDDYEEPPKENTFPKTPTTNFSPSKSFSQKTNLSQSYSQHGHSQNQSQFHSTHLPSQSFSQASQFSQPAQSQHSPQFSSPPSSQSSPQPPSQLTQEQLDMIERKRQAAMARKRALSQQSSPKPAPTRAPAKVSTPVKAPRQQRIEAAFAKAATRTPHPSPPCDQQAPQVDQIHSPPPTPPREQSTNFFSSRVSPLNHQTQPQTKNKTFSQQGKRYEPPKQPHPSPSPSYGRDSTSEEERGQKRRKLEQNEYQSTTVPQNDHSDDIVVEDQSSSWKSNEREKTTISQTSQPQSKPKSYNFGSALSMGSRKRTRADFSRGGEEVPEGRWEWLVNRRDGRKRVPDDPDYDATTLFIPYEATKKMTPTRKQYWEFKQKHMDVILFFQVGSFYELYEDDCVLGQRLLNLKVTPRANMSSCGVPLSAFEMWASKLVALGYKVARMDQNETIKHGNKSLKPGVDRELQQVLTAGTLTDSILLTDHQSNYLMVVCEKDDGQSSRGTGVQFGIVLVDAAVGDISLLQFSDDKQYTYFQTLVLQHKPKEFVFEKGKVSNSVQKLMKRLVCGPNITIIPQKTEGRVIGAFEAHDATEAFWLPIKDMVFKLQHEYFRETPMPEIFQQFVRQHGEQGFDTAEDVDSVDGCSMGSGADDVSLMANAFCGCLGYLESLKLAGELLRQGNAKIFDIHRQHDKLVLDCTALSNLEIFENSLSGTSDGTLIQFLDQCITPFGKRRLKQLVCRPLRDSDDLNCRLDAIEDLNDHPDFADLLRRELKGIPDLERLNSRLHARNIRYADFLTLLKWYKKLSILVRKIQSHSSFPQLRSLLLSLLKDSGGSFDDYGMDEERESEDLGEGGFPDLGGILALRDSIEMENSVERKQICPLPGTRENYDEAKRAIEEIEDELESYLKDVRASFGVSGGSKTALEYKHPVNARYTISISSSVLKDKMRGGRNYPEGLTLVKTLSTSSRFSSPFLKSAVTRLEEAEAILAVVSEGLFAEMVDEATNFIAPCREAISRFALLDVLGSLSLVSFSSGEMQMCRPQFQHDAEKAFIRSEQLRHPYLYAGGALEMVVPNSISVGKRRVANLEEEEEEENEEGEHEYNVLVLTGPNMGGKSTLLRQTCIAVIMAQIGCYLPASSCSMACFDRIFVRAGASDNIMAGQSTFMVELLETGNILDYATKDSLIVLDELGRGTSTWDGYSIAYAVVQFFCAYIPACVMFSTHYHSLVEELKDDKRIGLFHMACLIDENISFLYTLSPGLAESSFGMNVAQMAGIPKRLIEVAKAKSREEFEAQQKAIRWRSCARILESLSKCSDPRQSLVQIAEILRKSRLMLK